MEEDEVGRTLRMLKYEKFLQNLVACFKGKNHLKDIDTESKGKAKR
jgi:hypothetical protein